MWQLVLFVLGVLAGWKICELADAWANALAKPAYEQFGHRPKPRKLGNLYAFGADRVSVGATEYGHYRLRKDIVDQLKEFVAGSYTEPDRPLPADKFCIDEWEKVR